MYINPYIKNTYINKYNKLFVFYILTSKSGGTHSQPQHRPVPRAAFFKRQQFCLFDVFIYLFIFNYIGI